MTDGVPDIANADQHASWNGESGHRWVADADRRDRIMAPIAEALLTAADLRPGDRVLDVGCGCGATTLAAAGRVAPNGAVVGIDLSGPMLQVARSRAADRAVPAVEFVAGDAQTYALPARTFGVAISRFGTMFFADPAAAFANVAHGLSPGGRLCLATWQPLEANDWLMVPGAALLRYARLPESEPEAPGMFSQSHPDAVSATLRRAGFTDVELTPVRVTLSLGDGPAEAVDYIANTGIGRTALASVAEQDRPAALDAVRIALADHTDVHGVQLAAAIWIVGATLRL